MIKHIIFDWDNTLSITEPITFKIENEAAERLGISPQSRQLHKQTIGSDFKKALRVRFPGSDVDEIINTVYKYIYPKYLENKKIDQFSSRTLFALEELIKKGFNLHILTSRRYSGIKHIIDSTNSYSQLFETFHYLESTKFLKPDSRVFDNALKQIGAQPEECVYVGDTIDDTCAKEAGLLLIISLESGIRKKEDFDDYKVNIFIQDFSELVEAVESISCMNDGSSLKTQSANS